MTRSCNGAGYLGRRWKVRYLALGLLILFLGLATRPASALDGVVLPDPEQQDLYLSLLQEFRCADCRNASLLEASGVQATEMRREIRGLIEAGLSPAQIRDEVVRQYGAEVRLHWGAEGGTTLLWMVAGLIIAGTLGLCVVTLRPTRSSR